MTLFGEDTPLLHRLWIGLHGAASPKDLPEESDVCPLIVGHRGLQTRAPENTIASCKLAVEAGAQGVEIDVCVTRDGHVVLWHDRDPDERIARARQHGAEGFPFVPFTPDASSAHRKPVSELTFEELRGSFGYMRAQDVPFDWLGIDERADFPVERFDDFAAWAGAEPRLRAVMIDVKLAPAEAHLANALLETVETACKNHPAFREKWLPALCPQREIYETLTRGLEQRAILSCMCATPDFELPGVVRVAGEVGARTVSIGITPRRFWTSVREDVFDAIDARAAGQLDKVIAWTANTADEIATFFAAGVDAIVTDEVALARSIVRCTSGR